MKILFLQDDFPPQSFGGAGFSTYELALGMKRAGHEVFVVTTVRKEEDAGEFEYDGLKIFRIKSDYHEKWRAYRSLNNILVVQKVEALLQRVQPDVVHINNVHYHLSYRCFKVAKKYAKVVVFTARDTMSVCYGKLNTERYLKNLDYRTTWRDHLRFARKRYNPLRNCIIKSYLSYADRIFTVSKSLQEALGQNGIKNPKALHTGTDVSFWNTSEDEKKLFIKKYNLQDRKIVLFGGRLSEGKGGRKVVESMKYIVKSIPEAVLLVVGSLDFYAEKMMDEAKRLDIPDSILVTGWIPRSEVRVAYAASDAVVVPSLYLDPFPRIVVEAMAAGKPVVGTCYGGAPEIIVDGVTGYVVNPMHPEEIAEKVINLLENPEKSERFGHSGLERVRKDFNLEDKVKEYIVVYESLIRDRKPL